MPDDPDYDMRLAFIRDRAVHRFPATADTQLAYYAGARALFTALLDAWIEAGDDTSERKAQWLLLNDSLHEFATHIAKEADDV